MYKMCPICETNYIEGDDDCCEVCRNNRKSTRIIRDNNKSMVESGLLPLLLKMSEKQIKSLTSKEISFEIFKLQYPLLIECNDNDTCSKEIKDNNGHNRYYIKPYNLCGKKYHICSQWWSCGYNNKIILKLLNKFKNKYE